MKDFQDFLEIVNSDDFEDLHQEQVDRITEEYESHKHESLSEVIDYMFNINRQYTISALGFYHEWINRVEE